MSEARSSGEVLVDGAVVSVCVATTMLAAAPWLRSFPATVGLVPLLGAAALSVLLSALTARRRLVVAATLSLVGLALFEMLVVLQAPTGFGALRSGLVHGPAQLLSFALPLVSPRALLVDPVVLTWLCGGVAAAALTRRWASTMPLTVLVIAFGLSYAATQRAASPDLADAQLRETLLAVGLLAGVLLLRTLQIRATSSCSVRNLAQGTLAAVLVSAVAALSVQSAVFPKHASQPQRQPAVQTATPLTPVAYVAGLRPTSGPGAALFDVHTTAATTGYFALANVDYYDGAGWSFNRTFRASGGVVPDDLDMNLRSGPVISQSYRILAGPLTSSPWLIYQSRPQRVDGVDVNVDADSGMIVPARRLSAGSAYTVRSQETMTTFDRLDALQASPDTAAAAVDTQLPATLRATLDSVISALAIETGQASSSPIAFLQALQRDFRTHYALVGSSTPATTSATARAGGTGFSDVLASILGTQRTATPEQYATLTALLARDLGVPARVVSGFRVGPTSGSALLAAGNHVVRADQAWTWTEVAISGVGWVVLDSSPTTFRTPVQDSASGAAATPTPTPAPTSNALVTTGNGGNAVGQRSRVPHTRATHSRLWLVVLAAVLAGLLIGATGILALRKRIRAGRRRRRGAPAERVAAAWRETIDALYEAGLGISHDLDALTSSEIAARTRERFDLQTADFARAIGDAAERAIFQSAVVVREDEAVQAWVTQHEFRRAISGGLTVRGRLTAFVRFHRGRGLGRKH